MPHEAAEPGKGEDTEVEEEEPEGQRGSNLQADARLQAADLADRVEGVPEASPWRQLQRAAMKGNAQEGKGSTRRNAEEGSKAALWVASRQGLEPEAAASAAKRGGQEEGGGGEEAATVVQPADEQQEQPPLSRRRPLSTQQACLGDAGTSSPQPDRHTERESGTNSIRGALARNAGHLPEPHTERFRGRRQLGSLAGRRRERTAGEMRQWLTVELQSVMKVMQQQCTWQCDDVWLPVEKWVVWKSGY